LTAALAASTLARNPGEGYVAHTVHEGVGDVTKRTHRRAGGARISGCLRAGFEIATMNTAAERASFVRASLRHLGILE
jgi:hypothetical protein